MTTEKAVFVTTPLSGPHVATSSLAAESRVLLPTDEYDEYGRRRKCQDLTEMDGSDPDEMEH